MRGVEEAVVWFRCLACAKSTVGCSVLSCQIDTELNQGNCPVSLRLSSLHIVSLECWLHSDHSKNFHPFKEIYVFHSRTWFFFPLELICLFPTDTIFSQIVETNFWCHCTFAQGIYLFLKYNKLIFASKGSCLRFTDATGDAGKGILVLLPSFLTMAQYSKLHRLSLCSEILIQITFQ